MGWVHLMLDCHEGIIFGARPFPLGGALSFTFSMKSMCPAWQKPQLMGPLARHVLSSTCSSSSEIFGGVEPDSKASPHVTLNPKTLKFHD